MLADLLATLAPQLLARVQSALSVESSPGSSLATGRRRSPASGAGGQRALARVPELMAGLVEQLRADSPDTSSTLAHLSFDFEVAPVLNALRLLKAEVYAAIDAAELPPTRREMRVVGEWFAALAERTLAAENRRFADMLDALPDHLVLHSADGRLLFINRASAETAEALTGLPREALIGRRTIDLTGYALELRQHIAELITRVRGGESVTEEFILPGVDGGRWHEQHVRPLYGPDGKVDAIAIASRDINARKKAEARLQLLSKLGTLAETMEYEGVLDAVARLSIPELADWCIVDVVEDGQVRRGTIAHRDPDKAGLAQELMRFSPDAQTLPLGRHVLSAESSLIAEIDDAGYEGDPAFADIVRRLGARSVMFIPFVVLGAPVAVAAFVMTPESGRRHGPDDLALAQEMARRVAQIIENARLHQRLRQSEARFRVALDHSNITVFEEDTDFRIRWMHSGPRGFGERDFVGKTARELFSGEIHDELAAVKRRVLATGEGARTAITTVMKNQRRHFLLSYEPIRGVGGITGITGASVDITELKEVEEELAQELVFRERMMGILGHDLRNPVGAVLGLAGLLRIQDGVDDKAREGLQLIEQSARRMNEMINTLLDFTQLRFRGTLPMAIEEVDLDELARALVAELRAAHRGREIDLAATGDLRGHWDPGRMAQLLSNLVANALSHGAHGSPVRIALGGDGDGVVMSVSNQGPAIPPELVDRLFEPFQQGLDAQATGRARGLGLGLFIVREIVRAHGGTVAVRSGDDGTAFTVRLPRSAARP